ncbi:hypothetical protein LTR64_002363 [Lithohypha guttulata]|uniref:uncharacterized protein n=1 Tax=Lithohypha guttulata TaxID=1690604 RepID=UPI002DDE13DD|nr:hypothetical protein LTR51_001413 [Lithohypha guttulata]
MNGDSYGGGRESGRSREHYSSRHERDDRRDRDRDNRDNRRDGHRDRERRRSRSPHGHRSRREHDDSYSSSRNYREREREERYSSRRDDRGDWDRDRGPRRGGRDDRRDNRRGDRDLFDDRRGPRRGGGGGGADRQDDQGLREDRDEFAAQARGAKASSPPPKKREPTPDLTDVTPILERKRRLTQWDIKPPGYDNVTAEQAKLSGMFPLPGAPRQQMDQAKLQAFINQPTNADKSALKPATARQSKRLFLHNIPASATEESMLGWFNLHLNGLNVTQSSDPCISVNMSNDHSFAIAEFKTPQDTTVALALDGESTEEHVREANGNAEHGVKGLEIKRPKDYIVPSPDPEQYNALGDGGISTEVPDSEHKICISNIPSFLSDDQVIELAKSFGDVKAFVLVKDRGSDTSRGICFLEYADPEATSIAIEGLNGMDIGDNKLKTNFASIGVKQAIGMEMGAQAMSAFAGTQAADSQEGRVVQLLNMVTAEELIDNDEYEEICEDVQEECSKYGQIIDMKIPRPAGGSRQSNGVGKIFLKYVDAEAAKKALQSLAGRQFAQRTVVATYFDEASFEVNAW